MRRSEARFAICALPMLLASALVNAGCDSSGEPTGSKDGAAKDGGDKAPDGAASDAAKPPVCDVTLPTSCPDPAPHYAADVEPILKQRCWSCHDGKGEQWPLTTYSHVADWALEIRAQISKCTMPPPDSGITVPNEERETILAWLRCGFPK